MEADAIDEASFPFTGGGDSMVGKVEYEPGRVAVNATQGFENAPEVAWNFISEVIRPRKNG
jgi:hypothetical protein